MTHLLPFYGYWAVIHFVAMESTGIPFPGETMLLVAAIYAGTTHRLSIALVIVAAAAGAIIGDNLGFWVERAGGYRLLRRYGRYLRLDERKLKLGQYLFRQYGGKVVFLRRFMAVLRAWAAFLAGTNRLPWDRFLVYDASGGTVGHAVRAGRLRARPERPPRTSTAWKGRSAGQRSSSPSSSSLRSWSSCGATQRGWRTRQNGRCLAPSPRRPHLPSTVRTTEHGQRSRAVQCGVPVVRAAAHQQ